MISKQFLEKIKGYLKKSKELKKIGNKQKSLKPPVKFKQRNARIKRLLQIHAEGKQILKKLSKKSNLPKGLINRVKSIVQKVDHLKRENCLLQISGPLGVLKAHELCIFKERSRNNMIEVRKYFGLHKNVFYDDDISVAMAYTGPKLLQNYHTHGHLNEFTMVLSGNIMIKGKIGNKLKILHAEEGDITFAKRLTIHTLQNSTAKNALNATVKLPIGFLDRSNVDTLPKKHEGEIKVIKLKKEKEKWGESKHKTIKENEFTYKISLLTLNPAKSLKSVNRNDTAIYVLQGNVEVTGRKTKKRAKKNYLIFTQENCIIKNLSKKNTARLYCVTHLKRHAKKTKK